MRINVRASMRTGMRIARYIKDSVRSMKIRRKVLLIFLLIGVIPFLFYIILSNLYTNQIILERETTLAEGTPSQAVMSVENELETYNNLSNFIFNNTTILSALNTRYYTDYFKMYKAYQDTIEPLFLTYYALHPDLDNITIYTSCDLHPYNGYIKNLEELSEKEWYSLVEGKHTPVWTISTEDQVRYLYSTRIIGDIRKYKDINYLSLKVNYDALFAPFMNISDDSYNILIADTDQSLIFSTSELQEGDMDEILTSNQNSRYMLISSKLFSTGWTVYYYKEYDTLINYVNSITRNIYTFGWIILIFLGIMVLIISVSIVAPIEDLTSKIREVRNGDLQSLTVTIDSTRRDEIGVLFKNFSQMMEEIQHYMEVSLKNELEKKTYQQKILYAQINPHFLYNALSIINSKAIITGQDEISDMVLLISTFYRTALNRGNDITTLENELINIQSYIQIQLLSYSEPISVSYDINSTLAGIHFPNFILQPIIENALDHGLKNSLKPSKALHISVDREIACLDGTEKEYILIIIDDNGVGMEKENVRYLFETQTKGYGIKNVNHRLKLLYGADYSFVIQSTPDAGTNARLLIPIT